MVEGKGQIPEEIGEVPAQDQALPEETEPKADPSSMTKVVRFWFDFYLF